MLRRGDFSILGLRNWRTFQIENPTFCEGTFQFSNRFCLRCPFHVECELVSTTEFGFSGRPDSILKEYLFALPFFYKVVLPEKVEALFPFLVPKHLPPKIRQIVRRQLRVVYKMFLFQELISRWKIVPLQEGNYLNYYSRLEVPSPYFEWFSQEQLARISLTIRSLISRTGSTTPYAVITIESSGWFCNCIKEVASFPYAEDAFFWMDASFPEAFELRRAQESLVGTSFIHRRLPLVTLTTPAILVWQIGKQNFIKYSSWIWNNRTQLKYVVALFDELMYFKLLQCFLLPLAVDCVSYPESHFPYVALFKVLRKGKSFRVRRSALEEIELCD